MTDRGEALFQAPPLIRSEGSRLKSKELSRTLRFSGTSWGPLRTLGQTNVSGKLLAGKTLLCPSKPVLLPVDAKDRSALSPTRTGGGGMRVQVGDQLERDLAG